MKFILIAYSLHFVRYGIVFPLIPLVAGGMGAGPSAIGFLVGSFSLMALFLSVPLGGLTDRFGVKRLLLLGALCNIASAAILLGARSVTALILAQLLGGVAFQVHVIGSQAFVSHLPAVPQRTSIFGYLSFCASAGQTVGPALGGVLASRFGYQTTFLAVLALSMGGLVMLGLKEKRDVVPDETSYSLRRDLKQAAGLATEPRLFMMLSFTFSIIFAASLRASFLPVLLRDRGASEALVGLLISVFAGTSSFVRIFFGRLLELIGRKAMLVISVITAAIGVGLIPVMPSTFAVGLILAVFGLSFGFSQPLSMVMVAELAHPNHSGLAMGLRFTSIMLANLVGPIFLGFVVAGFGTGSAFHTATGIVVAVGIHILVRGKWQGGA